MSFKLEEAETRYHTAEMAALAVMRVVCLETSRSNHGQSAIKTLKSMSVKFSTELLLPFLILSPLHHHHRQITMSSDDIASIYPMDDSLKSPLNLSRSLSPTRPSNESMRSFAYEFHL